MTLDLFPKHFVADMGLSLSAEQSAVFIHLLKSANVFGRPKIVLPMTNETKKESYYEMLFNRLSFKHSLIDTFTGTYVSSGYVGSRKSIYRLVAYGDWRKEIGELNQNQSVGDHTSDSSSTLACQVHLTVNE